MANSFHLFDDLNDFKTNKKLETLEICLRNLIVGKNENNLENELKEIHILSIESEKYQLWNQLFFGIEIIQFFENNSKQLFSLFSRLCFEFKSNEVGKEEKNKRDNNVFVNGLKVELNEMNYSFLWLRLFPFCLYLNSFRKQMNLKKNNDEQLLKQIDFKSIFENNNENKNYVDEIRIIIGIVGAPGAGKSVFSEILKRALDSMFSHSENNNHLEISCVVSMDAYHFPNSYLDSHDGIGLGGGTESKLRKLKGDPITIDSHSLSVDLKRLKNQSEEEIVKLPIYDRANTHDPIPNQQPVLPSHKFIILEGLYLAVREFGFGDVCDNLDFRIFLNINLVESEKRVVERKVKTGRSFEEATRHFQNVDKNNWNFITLKSIPNSNIVFQA